MGDPRSYLPPLIGPAELSAFASSLGLPPPARTEPLVVTAFFHRIYLLHFPPSAAAALAPARPNPDGSITLVLRVAGPHLPRLKTENEVAAMRWVRSHTAVPVPAVLRWDASCDNLLGHEFSLLERVPGTSADKAFWAMGEPQRRNMAAQLVGFVAELHDKSAGVWGRAVGGLRVDEHGEIVPGPVSDEWFWAAPEIARFWPSGEETVESLNPVQGPFEGWAAHLDASVEKYIYAIARHASLAWMRDLVPRLEAFRAYLRAHREEMDDTRYVLAHRDMHLANVVVDADGAVTGLLDWEFAGVVPAPRWDPPNAFLYPWGGEGDDAEKERDRMRGLARAVCAERGLDAEVVDGVAYRGVQEAAQRVATLARAICEVCPRGRGEKAGAWREALERELETLGF